MLFHLPLLSFAVVKRIIYLLFFGLRVKPGSYKWIDLSSKKIIVQNIIKDYTHLANSGKTIVLCWIPSHVNIRGSKISSFVAHYKAEDSST